MESSTTHPRWASREQAAEHVGVSVFTIDRWRIKGLITARRAGGVVRFDLNEIDAVLLGGGADEPKGATV